MERKDQDLGMSTRDGRRRDSAYTRVFGNEECSDDESSEETYANSASGSPDWDEEASNRVLREGLNKNWPAFHDRNKRFLERIYRLAKEYNRYHVKGETPSNRKRSERKEPDDRRDLHKRFRSMVSTLPSVREVHDNHNTPEES